MQAIIYIFEKVGDPWYKTVCRTPFTTDYESLEQLEKRCANFVAGNERIVEVNAFGMYNRNNLVSIVKSEKRKA